MSEINQNTEVFGPQPLVVLTAGRICEDGSSITLLRDNKLLHYCDGQETVAAEVVHQGQAYKPAILDPVLASVLRLPAKSGPFSDATSLTTELQEYFSQATGLEESDSLLLAMFVLATWVSEALPGALLLNVWGSGASRTAVQQILESLCHHPLPVADPSIRELADITPGLNPCLVLHEPSPELLRRLQPATSSPQLRLLRRGRLLTLHCSIAASTEKRLELPALQVHCSSSNSRLSAQQIESLIDRFQPRLLAYRLRRLEPVASSQFDVPGFTGAARVLARTLGAAAEGEPDLQASLVSALGRYDESLKSNESESLETAVLEVLLAVVHEGQKKIRVGEIAELTTALLLARTDDRRLSAKGAGQLLRNLGFFAPRRREGHELSLEGTFPSRLHTLAAARQALSMIDPLVDCEMCRKTMASKTDEGLA